MPEGDIILYNSFKLEGLSKIHDLSSGGDTIRITLHTGYTPNVDSHETWSDVNATEYSTGSGYTANGKVLSTQTLSRDDTNDRTLFNGVDLTWASLGALSPATPSHAIIWNDSVAGDPLIGYIVLGTQATNGNDYVISWDNSPEAIFTQT